MNEANKQEPVGWSQEPLGTRLLQQVRRWGPILVEEDSRLNWAAFLRIAATATAAPERRDEGSGPTSGRRVTTAGATTANDGHEYPECH